MPARGKGHHKAGQSSHLSVQQRHHTFHMTRPTRATAAKNNPAAVAASTPAISESLQDLLQQGKFPGIYINHVNTINVHNYWPSHDAPDSIEDPVDEEETRGARALTQLPPEFNENMFLKAASKTGAKISLRRPTTYRSAPDLEGSDDDENESSVGPQIPAKGTGRTARTRSKAALLPVLEEDPPEASHDLKDQYLPTKSAKGYTYVSPSNIKVPESDQYQNRIEEARNSVSELKKTSRKTSSAKTSTSTKPPVSKRGKGMPPAKRKKDKNVVGKEDEAADHLEDLSDISPGNKSA